MPEKIYRNPEIARKFPLEVKRIFKIFKNNIRLVGGASRDIILKKKPNDYDFATPLKPDEIIEILQKNKVKAIPTGKKFGTITAVINKKNFEITTLRSDKNPDGRHCDVEFVSSYFEDAKRRDFTINAFYIDEFGNIFDYFDSFKDLKKQKVKFIGNAKERITEDYLRILRFFRFSCNFAKSLDKYSLKSAEKLKKNLKNLSTERIRQEFYKFISSENQKNLIKILKKINKLGFLEEIFSSKANIKSVTKLFYLSKKFSIEISEREIFSSIFISKNSDIKKISKEICATKIEGKFFKNYQKFIRDFGNLKNKQEKRQFFNYLVFANDKKEILQFYLIHFSQNFTFLKYFEFKNFVNYQKNLKVKNLPIKSADLIKLGFKNKEIGEGLKKAELLWAKSEFNLSKKEILNFLTN